MGIIDKDIQKLYDAPRSISRKHLIKILRSLGCIERTAKGSHLLFKHPLLTNGLTVPDQNPLLVGYITQARKYIEQIREKQYDEKES